ncbi:MAG: hypothetical protein RL291_811 [Pseudomonadota bacterium]
MRRWIFGLGFAGMLGGIILIAAGPFLTLMTLARAFYENDAKTLAQLTDFPSVRATLKTSLRKNPDTGGFWQRFAVRAMPSMTADLIDHYVSPEGLPKLLAHRTRAKTVQARVGVDQQRGTELLKETDLAETPVDRGLRLLQRIEHIAWPRMDQLVFDLADRKKPQRAFRVTLAYRSAGWQLTGVEIIPRTNATTTTTTQRSTARATVISSAR